MRNLRTVLVCLLTPFLTGTYCLNRVGFFQYDLTQCPSESFLLPERAKFGEWGIESDRAPWECPGTSYFRMGDEKARSGGGFGFSDANAFYATISRNRSCHLLLAFRFAGGSNSLHAQETLRYYGDTAAQALFQDALVGVKLPAKKFEVIGKREDFSKWCARKALPATPETERGTSEEPKPAAIGE